MSKPKYTKPVLSSIGLPVKRAQGFEIEGFCGAGSSAGGPGGACEGGTGLSGDIPSHCGTGFGAATSCGSGFGQGEVSDGCESGITIYGGAPCSAGSNN